jgi:hypothetical protein
MALDFRRVERLEPAMAEVLQRRTPGERLALGMELHRTARLMIAGSLRAEHPDWTEEQVAAEVARRMLYGSA